MDRKHANNDKQKGQDRQNQAPEHIHRRGLIHPIGLVVLMIVTGMVMLIMILS